jgi:hypothetical protein
MKKILLVIGLTVLVLGAMGVGIAYAQGGRPPIFHMMSQAGHGWMHEYVQQAFASKLGLTDEQVQDQYARGRTMYQIARDNGIAQEDLVTFMNEIHQEAFDKAVKDGLATQEQAGWMLARMQKMQQGEYGRGDCPMHTGQGDGMMSGSGMMGGIWGPGIQKP